MKRIIVTNLTLAMLIVAGILNVNGQPSTTSANSKLEAEITKVLRGYFDAYSRRDGDTAVAAWADGGFTYERGYATTKELKETLPAFLRSPAAANSKDSYEMEGLKVLPVTADTAIANFTLVWTTIQAGKSDVRRDITTSVFVRRDDRWQIVADHTSLLPKPLQQITSGMPVGWIRMPADSSSSYMITVDKANRHGGGSSTSIKYACADEDGFGSIGQSVAADEYLGKRLRLSGWLKTESAGWAGLWMRMDGNGRLLGFDNMGNRPVTGTTAWKQFDVVLDVPAGTVNIVIGTLLSGKGQLWLDDLKLEIVGSDVPVTNQLSAEQMNLDRPNRNPKKAENKQPINLGFEGGIVP